MCPSSSATPSKKSRPRASSTSWIASPPGWKSGPTGARPASLRGTRSRRCRRPRPVVPVRHSAAASDGSVVHASPAAPICRPRSTSIACSTSPWAPIGRTPRLMLKPDTVLIGLHCTRTTVSAIVSPKGGRTSSAAWVSAAVGSPPTCSGCPAKSRSWMTSPSVAAVLAVVLGGVAESRKLGRGRCNERTQRTRFPW